MKKLYSICWNITNNCNEKCEFCYRKMCRDNSLEENKKIVDNIIQIDIDKITFSGGEPLLYKPLFELAEYIKTKRPNIKLSLTTNTLIIDDEVLKKIYNLFDNISLSIDSVKESTLNDLGRGKKHLKSNKKILNKINKKIKIKINTIATACNFEELEEILKFISNYNISRWKIFRFYPIRDAKLRKDKFYIDDKNSEIIRKQIIELQKMTDIKIQYNDNSDFTTSYFNIYPDGSVENSADEDIGYLLNESILDLLKLKEDELVNHYLRNNEL